MKDLTLEAGSGLIVLDPVDISGGYTSFKDKINISFLSTDICVHLSLSVLSLLLNLQTQATTALQFGNADPLCPCTNFERIWVSPKGHTFSEIFPPFTLQFEFFLVVDVFAYSFLFFLNLLVLSFLIGLNLFELKQVTIITLLSGGHGLLQTMSFLEIV